MALLIALPVLVHFRSRFPRNEERNHTCELRQPPGSLESDPSCSKTRFVTKHSTKLVRRNPCNDRTLAIRNPWEVKSTGTLSTPLQDFRVWTWQRSFSFPTFPCPTFLPSFPMAFWGLLGYRQSHENATRCHSQLRAENADVLKKPL